MNEHQVENLLSQHGDDILAKRQPKVLRRHIAWKPILVTASAFLAIGLFVLLPKNAEAARVLEIQKAFDRVKSVETQSQNRSNGGPWYIGSKVISVSHLTRIEGNKGRGQKFTMVSDSNKTLISYERLPFATISKKDPKELAPFDDLNKDPLRSALYILEGGNSPEDSTIRSTKGKPFNGRNTYEIHVQKIDTKQKQIVIVDEFTNLPIESINFIEIKGISHESRIQYFYDRVYDPSLFTFKSNKPVYDLDVEKSKIQALWSQSKYAKSEAPIYSSSITPDGTIWIAFGVKSVQDMVSVPSRVMLPGSTYRLAKEFPLTNQPANKDFKINGHEVVIAAFVPVYGKAMPKGPIPIYFERRELGKRAESPRDETVRAVAISKEAMQMPEFLIAFGFQRTFIDGWMELWRAKAEAREVLGDLLGAARAYEEEAIAFKNFVEYAGYRPMLKAADCYEKLGALEKATQLRTKAAELQRTRVR